MSLRILLAFVAICALAAGSQPSDLYGVLNILYLKADPDLDGKITENELASIYTALDRNNDSIVSESEFETSWSALTRQSVEMAHAYFDMSDIDHDGKLTQKDSDVIFTRFDLDGDNFVSANEFKKEYSMVYHAIPFVILGERVLKAQGKTSGHINKAEFQTLFHSLKAHGSIDKASLEKAWVDEHFGTAKDADSVMYALDTDDDNVISSKDLGFVFTKMDRNGDGFVNIDELKNLLLHQVSH